MIAQSIPLDIPDTPDARAVTLLANDVVSASGGTVLLSLDPAGDTEIKMRNSRMKLLKDETGLVCEVTKGLVQFTRDTAKRFRKGVSELCEVLAAKVRLDPDGTDFVVKARPTEASIFVMEGKVHVTNLSAGFAGDEKTVHAGQWLRARADEALPDPARFRPRNARTGGTECIYSNCTLTDKIPIPPPPVFTPGVLIPPPPNPPAQR